MILRLVLIVSGGIHSFSSLMLLRHIHLFASVVPALRKSLSLHPALFSPHFRPTASLMAEFHTSSPLPATAETARQAAYEHLQYVDVHAHLFHEQFHGDEELIATRCADNGYRCRGMIFFVVTVGHRLGVRCHQRSGARIQQRSTRHVRETQPISSRDRSFVSRHAIIFP